MSRFSLRFDSLGRRLGANKRRFSHLSTALLLALAFYAVPPAQAAESRSAAMQSVADTETITPLPDIKTLCGLAPYSLQSTGLLDYLAPYLTKDTGLAVIWSTAGDSQTLERARKCDGDLLLTENSAPAAQLIKDGYGLNSREIMSDSFVLAGPSYDPARVLGLDIVDALKGIADKHAPFASRGDASGTHQRELALWKKAEQDVRDGKNGYVEVGQGMTATLDIAAAAQAYVLADRATFLTWSAAHGSPLALLSTDKALLERAWRVIPLNSALCGKANKAAKAEENRNAADSADVQAVADWLASPAAQKRIADFTREGEKVFRPALPVEEELPGTRQNKK